MNARIHIALLIAALFLTAACSNHTEHSGFTTIDPDGWIYGDTVRFCPADTDSIAFPLYDVVIVVRNNNDYEYSNLWLRLDYQCRDSVHTDTLNIRLADDFGNWLGKGTGGSYQRCDTVLHGVPLDPAREIKVSHIMRTDTLGGIEQFGIIVKKSNHPLRPSDK